MDLLGPIVVEHHHFDLCKESLELIKFVNNGRDNVSIWNAKKKPNNKYKQRIKEIIQSSFNKIKIFCFFLYSIKNKNWKNSSEGVKFLKRSSLCKQKSKEEKEKKRATLAFC